MLFLYMCSLINPSCKLRILHVSCIAWTWIEASAYTRSRRLRCSPEETCTLRTAIRIGANWGFVPVELLPMVKLDVVLR